MTRFLVCANAQCRFLLDSRVEGSPHLAAQSVIPKCPACGGSWSSTCPSCGQPLAVKSEDGLPRLACCSPKGSPEQKLHEHPSALAASV